MQKIAYVEHLPDGRRIARLTEVSGAECRAARLAELRSAAWSEVDLKESLAGLAIVVRELVPLLSAERQQAMAPAIDHLERIAGVLKGWGQLEAAAEQATTWEDLQRLALPPVDLRPPRAAEIARGARPVRDA